MSSTSGSTLADLRQTIADLERQLAECRAERDEALQRETATAEVLGVINSSPGDLALTPRKKRSLGEAIVPSLVAHEPFIHRVHAGSIESDLRLVGLQLVDGPVECGVLVSRALRV